ncbi:hypothetical protein M0811_14153 [Anaeramoeba ignava]|uniref:Fibronectin type-III domain-containing protein n=1 Tax=Anaeramoeba ignava TaxID=1746090 RepID=A0A9Q0LUC8_ANAIG|nr:hypothetical protein M0811_14153 [Anaeramoeba ignava]
MKSILFFSFFLIFNIYLIKSIQNDPKYISSSKSSKLILKETETETTTKYYPSLNEVFFWRLISNFSFSSSLSGFGYSTYIYKDLLVITAPFARKAFIYRYNGTNFDLQQTLDGPSFSTFGYSVSIYEDVIVIGGYYSENAFIYRYNGIIWNLQQTLSVLSISGFGYSVSIYEDVIVVAKYFGYSVSVYGNVIVVGAFVTERAFIYRYNGIVWNLEQILHESSLCFGYSVSIYDNVIVVGAYGQNQTFIYRYNGIIWNLEQILSESAKYFGYSVSVYENFTAVGAWSVNQTFVYEFIQIPQVNILNCSSLFSSFDFGIDIESPIFEDGNVYYQLFNSSNYDNITGNEFYSIQIKVCASEIKCDKPSSFINLTTKIDSVKDLQLTNANSSINVTWNPPNVKINEGIAHLDHYNLSYFNQSQPNSISFVSVANSSLSYFLNNLKCGNDYNISICGCRTPKCEGNDKGEVANSLISLLFEKVGNLTCSISNLIDINCNWNQPINCSTPSYYNFTYQSISQNDSGNYQPISSNQQFTAQIPNQQYQINVSACNSDGKCGYISTTSITTDNLPIAPIIYETISKIEEIEFNFTKLTNANNYSISLNNETNWQKFTSLDLSGNEIIGIISGISGNVEYNISIRGCADLNCETPYLGLPSSIISTRAKLGNITTLNCISLINGFECSWDSLILSSGLKAYSFHFNSISICLSKTTNFHSESGLKGGEYYEISIYSSADSNCLINEYSGINSKTSITTLSPTESKESSSKTSIIAISILFPILITGIIIVIIIIIKKKRTPKIIFQEEDKELEPLTDIELF